MAVHEFYYCYLHEVLDIVNSFFKLEEQRQLAEWERTRMVSFFTVKPHDSKKRIKKPSSLFELSSDKRHRKTDKDLIHQKIKRDLEIQQKRIAKLKEKGLIK